MVKVMHYKVRGHRNTFTNRMIGIALCGNWGRSLKNFTSDWAKVECRKCIRLKGQEPTVIKVGE